MGLTELKIAYGIPAAWRDLGLPGAPGKCVSSPFRKDDSPSFSVFADGTRWMDHGTAETGDIFDFIERARGCKMAEAIRFVKDRLGITRPDCKSDEPKSPNLKIPTLHRGTEDELRELTERRGFNVDALRLAEQRGFLHFATLWGNAAWCITDARRALFELRRLDGRYWEAYGALSERKSHCIGRGKNWPLGLNEAARFGKIIVCEGAPDFLAAHHFAFIENKTESVGIVCVLGASNHKLAQEALVQFKGKVICLYPHLDGAGQTAAQIWARQLKAAGAARVTAFDFSGLMLVDGTQGKDMADVCRISADCLECERKFAEVLP